MLPGLENGHRYHKAAVAAGYNHAMLPTGEVLDELPYYGEKLSRYMADVPSASDPDEQKFGRIANPTVHVALNQLRRVVNELIQLHGHPGEIVVELARELPLGKDDLRERENEQRNNQDRNEELRSEIKTLLREAGVTDGEIQTALQRGDALLRMRLWKELGKPPGTLCPYTLKPIGIRGLFSHEVHIDHILPFRRTHDDSYSNKTICLRRANEIKKDMSPWEAFHTNPAGYDWERILLQSTSLPKNKGWRFAEDAMKKSKRLDRFGLPKELLDQFDEQNDFLASHLVDTRYIARVTREYLTAVCHPYRVWPITGNTTALLRGKWNLSACLPTHNVQGSDDKLPVRKRRIDHRHHAIDAFVVGCTDRSMLQKVASAADDQRDRLIERMPEPWDGFRDDLRDALRRIVVSFRPDHGSTGIDPKTGRSRTTGALHNDTAYFPISGPHADGTFEVVSRKLISNFESMDEVSDISDSPLRDALKTFVEAKKAEGLKIKDACGLFAQETGIRKVRMKEHLIVIPIRKDSIGHPYKAYKGDSNDYMEIWRLPNGKWTAQTVSTFDANQPQAKTRKRPHPASTFDANQPQAKTRKRPHPAAKLLMRIYNDDLARLEDDDGQVRTMRVVKTSKQTVVLADHFEAGNLKDRDDKTRKANKAAKEGQLIDDRDPDAVLAETGGFAYFSRAASKLRDMKFRKLYVSPSGRVRDPGPPK
jgi:CRISPR-associated endonuclease Csn1